MISSKQVRGAFALTFALAMLAATCLLPAGDASGKAAGAQAPIMIEREGSFTAGGTITADPTKGTLHCDHGFVDYQIPVHARKTALFLWHSSSVQVWQQRWDGGEGYQQIFLRRGFAVYLWDGPRVGRGNMSCESYTYIPVIGQDQRNIRAWRLGPAAGEWFPGVQFPKDDAAALDRAMSERYDEFDVAKNAHLEAEAAAKAVDQIGPTVLVTNSAGGWRGMLAALKSDNVKAIVAYESAAYVFPEGEGPQEPEGGFGPTHVPLAEFMKLTRIPIQLVWGDNTEKTAWVRNVEMSRRFADVVNAHGGHAEVLMLPSVGVMGNTHLAFADLNNVQVADQLALFLKRNHLDQ
jgi:hypothetical protein